MVTSSKRVVGACVVAVMASLWTGCVYLQDKLGMELGDGDVTGVLLGTKPGEAGLVPLADARVRVRGSSTVRTTNAAGRFVVRNLPAGSHLLDVTWDRDHDGVPELGGVIPVAIRRIAATGKRPGVDVGSSTLLVPGVVLGQVSGTPPFDDVAVDLFRKNPLSGEFELSDLRAFPDPQTGTFHADGVGEGAWELAAARPGQGSQRVGVTVASGQSVQASQALQLAALGSGSVSLSLLQPPAPTSKSGVGVTQQGLFQDISVQFTRVVDGVVLPSTGLRLVRADSDGLLQLDISDIPAGVYHVVVDPGDGLLPLRFSFVVVTGVNGTFGQLLPAALTEDMDGDGLPFAGDQHCAATCATLGRDMAQPCNESGADWDCDDDGDNQADVVEMLGTNHPRECRCTATGFSTGAPTCEKDPFRADQDLDGVCDVYDRCPGTPAGQPDCAAPPTDAGIPDAAGPQDAAPPVDAFVPDAFVPDAFVPDAFVPDAFVPDAFVPDAFVDVDAGVVDAGLPPPVDRGPFDLGAQSAVGAAFGARDAGMANVPRPPPTFVTAAVPGGGFVLATVLQTDLQASGPCAAVALQAGGIGPVVVIKLDALGKCVWVQSLLMTQWSDPYDPTVNALAASADKVFVSVAAADNLLGFPDTGVTGGMGVLTVASLDATTGAPLASHAVLETAAQPTPASLLVDPVTGRVAWAVLQTAYMGGVTVEGVRFPVSNGARQGAVVRVLGPDLKALHSNVAAPKNSESQGTFSMGPLSLGSTLLPLVGTDPVALSRTDGGITSGAFVLKGDFPDGAPDSLEQLPVTFGSSAPELQYAKTAAGRLVGGTTRGDVTLAGGAFAVAASPSAPATWVAALDANATAVNWVWQSTAESIGTPSGQERLHFLKDDGALMVGTAWGAFSLLKRAPGVFEELHLNVQPPSRDGEFLWAARVDAAGVLSQLAAIHGADAASSVALQGTQELGDGSLVFSVWVDGTAKASALGCDGLPTGTVTTLTGAAGGSLVLWHVTSQAMPPCSPNPVQLPAMDDANHLGKTLGGADAGINTAALGSVMLDVAAGGDEDCVKVTHTGALRVRASAADGTCGNHAVLAIYDVPVATIPARAPSEIPHQPAPQGTCDEVQLRASPLTVCVRGFAGQAAGPVKLELTEVTAAAQDVCVEPSAGVPMLTTANRVLEFSGTTWAAAAKDAPAAASCIQTPDLLFPFTVEALGRITVERVDEAGKPQAMVNAAVLAMNQNGSDSCTGLRLAAGTDGCRSVELPGGLNPTGVLYNGNTYQLAVAGQCVGNPCWDGEFKLRITYEPPSSNVDCSTAEALTFDSAHPTGTLHANYFGRTMWEAISCPPSQGGPASWHKIHLPEAGAFQVQNQGGTMVEVYDSMCPGPAVLQCSPEPSAVMNVASDGTTDVFVRVQQYGPMYAGASVEYSLPATFTPAPANDACPATAPALQLGPLNPLVQVQGSNMGARFDVANDCNGSGAGYADVVYAVEFSEAGALSVRTTDAINGFNWILYEGGCDLAQERRCSTLTDSPDSHVSVLPGRTYQLVIQGTYNVRSDFSLELGFHPLAANDQCAGAIALGSISNSNPAITLTTTGTLDTSQQWTSSQCGYGMQVVQDAFFTFTALDSGTLLVRAITNPVGFFGQVFLATGTCGSATEVACQALDWRVATNGMHVDAGTSYTLIVQSDVQRAFDLDLRLFNPGQVEDLCENGQDLLATWGAAGSISGTLGGAFASDQNNVQNYPAPGGGACLAEDTGGPNSSDGAVSFTLNDGQSIELELTPDAYSYSVLYVLDVCPNAGSPQCLGGSDAGKFTFTNTTGATKTFHAILDTYGSSYGYYLLAWKYL